MVSYRALSLGADTFDLGLIAASYALLSVLAAIPAGRLMDRHGAKRFVIAALLLVTLTTVVLAASRSLAVLVIAQAIMGLGQIVAVVGFQTLVANAGPVDGSESRFGAFAAIVSLGQMVGPALAGLVAELGAGSGADAAGSEQSTTLVFGVLALLSAASLPFALAIRERAVLPAEGALPVRSGRSELWRTVRRPTMRQAMFASVAVLCSIDILNIYLPAWGEAKQWSVGLVSALLATRAAASLTVRLFMGALIRRLGRRRPLAVGTGLGAVALACLPWCSARPVLFALMVVVGLVLGIGQPLTMAWVARAAPTELRSSALAVRLTANRLGQLVVPVAVGAVAGLAGPAMIFYSLTLLLASTTALVLRSGLDEVVEPPAPSPGPG